MVSEDQAPLLDQGQRLHRLSWVFIVGKILKQNIIVVILLLLSGAVFVLQVLAVIIFLSFLYGFIFYKNYRYQMTDDALVIREGVFQRTVRRVPFSRIQNLNLVETPVHRAFSVAELQIESGSGLLPEAKMVVLGLSEIAELRRSINAGRASVQDHTEPAYPQEPSRPWLALSWRDLLIYGVIGLHGWIPIAAVLSILADVGQTWLVEIERQLLERGYDLMFQFEASNWWHLLAIMLTIFVVILVFSMIFVLVKFSNFRLWIEPRRLRLQFGLISRIDADIPLQRIQTLSFRKTLLHRLFQKVSVSLETVGGNASEDFGIQVKWLAPVLPEKDWPALLAQIHPEIEWSHLSWQPISRRAWWRLTRRNSLLLALVTAILSLLVGVKMLLLMLALPFIVLHARKSCSAMSYSLTDHALVFRSGWPNHWLSVVRLGKIQALTLRQTPFDQSWKMSCLQIDTAGARKNGHRLNVRYMDQEQARSLHQQLAMRVTDAPLIW